jgi:hypothetical protein
MLSNHHANSFELKESFSASGRSFINTKNKKMNPAHFHGTPLTPF